MTPKLHVRRRALSILSGCGLVLYLAVLIYSNYYHQARLARSLREEFNMQVQIAVGAVGDFFDERKFEMTDLLASRELTAYFENAALGMSEEYGLRQSLSLVHARLLSVTDRKKASGTTLYERIALYDMEGGMLTDTSPPSDADASEQSEFPFAPSLSDTAQRVIYRGDEILLVTPCEFKGKINGGIVAWLQSSTVLSVTENQMRANDIQWRLLAETSEGYHPVGYSGNNESMLPSHNPEWPGSAAGTFGKEPSSGYPMAMLRSHIPGTPFALESMVPSGKMLGWNFPTASVLGLAVLALALLVALLSFLRMNDEAIATAIRLEETERTADHISASNAMLLEEIESRKQAEQKLADSEKLLASVIAGADVGIWDWNIRTGETVFNERWAEMLGHRLEDLEPLSIGTWEKLCHPEDLAASNRLFESIFAGDLKRYDCEVRMRHASGHWVWVLDRGMVVEWDENGQPLRASGTHLDISERKKAEEALTESEQRLQAILHAIPDSVVLVDRNRTILWANKTCFSRYGESVLGKRSWEACLQQDSPPEADVAIEDLGRWTVNEQEVSVIDDSGASGTVLHLTVAVSLDDDGVPDRFVEIFRDISEKKKLEEELREKQKMGSIGQLAGGIAHGLNNALQSVNGYAELAISRLPNDDPLARTLANVASAGERGARLVKQLLAFSRRQVMRRESLDLNSLISSQLEVTRAAAAPRVNIEFTPRAGLESIYGDRSMCEQIVQNLCSNACDAMPEGGTLLIEAKNVSLNKAECVALSLLEAGAYVKLTVTDTGLGMDSDTLHRVFEPFFTTKPIEKGTGLGLSTAYGNARQHDGTISAASVPGRGSTFMVFLPASKIASAVERESAPPSLQTGTPVETVLFAEDEMPIRLLGRRILENVGYKVIEARDGKEAVKLYKENSDQIDILLFDVMMPNMDGQDAYNEICSINPGVSVVFASAYGSINIDDKIFTRENTAYVQKPFKAAELLAAVRLTLDARSAASLGHL